MKEIDILERESRFSIGDLKKILGDLNRIFTSDDAMLLIGPYQDILQRLIATHREKEMVDERKDEAIDLMISKYLLDSPEKAEKFTNQEVEKLRKRFKKPEHKKALEVLSERLSQTSTQIEFGLLSEETYQKPQLKEICKDLALWKNQAKVISEHLGPNIDVSVKNLFVVEALLSDESTWRLVEGEGSPSLRKAFDTYINSLQETLEEFNPDKRVEEAFGRKPKELSVKSSVFTPPATDTGAYKNLMEITDKIIDNKNTEKIPGDLKDLALEVRLPYTRALIRHPPFDEPPKLVFRPRRTPIQNVSFEQMGGYERQKNFFKKNLEWISSGETPPFQSVLLVGPTGTGKTMSIHSFVNQLPESCRTVFVDGYAPLEFALELTKNREDYFFVFVDEDIDRGQSLQRAPRSEYLKLGSKLNLAAYPRRMVIATTNVPGVVDPAILGPHRFKVLPYEIPKREEREEIISLYVNKFSLSLEDEERKNLTEKMKGFTPAEIRGVISSYKFYKPKSWDQVLEEMERTKEQRERWEATQLKKLREEGESIYIG